MSALIELSSGRNIIEENVDGKLSYGDFYQLMKERWGSEGSINKITFLDTNNDIHNEDEEAFNNNVNNDENTTISMKNNHRVPYMINSPLRRTLWENDNGECVPSSSSRVISLTDVMSDLKPPVKNNNQQSVWSTAMFGLQKSGIIFTIVFTIFYLYICHYFHYFLILYFHYHLFFSSLLIWFTY